MIFFTSDLHFGHKRAIEFCNRPYKDVEAMNEGIINRWNQVVGIQDEVYVLGDVSFAGKKQTQEILDRLNGVLYLIRGNHDKGFSEIWLKKRFVWAKDLHTLKVCDDGKWLSQPDGKQPTSDPQRIVMCHYPLLSWENMHHGAWHLHGHCHGSLAPDPMGYHKRIDVGIDCFGEPVSYTRIKIMMDRLVFKPVDHHKWRQEYGQ